MTTQDQRPDRDQKPAAAADGLLIAIGETVVILLTPPLHPN